MFDMLLMIKQHKQTHQPRDYECLGCDHLFKSFSGELIHLESGNCDSGIIEEDVDDKAHQCYQNRKYIIRENGWSYICPNCERRYTKLSALYQHAEDSPDCSYLLEHPNCLAKLQHFISWSL